jgi:uncharacterized protein YbbC (DUF1343 family)
MNSFLRTIFLSLSLSLLLLLSILPSFSGSAAEKVGLGNEMLRENSYAFLQGHRVAVLSNPTGVYDDSLTHIVDDMYNYLQEHPTQFDLVAILSPEHGFRGELQAETSDPAVYIDSYTRLPIFSAYQLSTENITSIIEEFKLTMIIVDIQDVGVRLYTFIW